MFIYTTVPIEFWHAFAQVNLRISYYPEMNECDIISVFVKSNILNFNVIRHYLYFNIFILQIFITINWIVIETWLEIAVIRQRPRQLPRKQSHHINGQLGLIQIELLWNTWNFYDNNLLALQFEKILIWCPCIKC